MALIIKGDMPKGKCWWHDENGKEHECQFFPCTGDADNCPILCEIPDKHGELIDRMSAIHRIEAEFDSDIAQDIIGLLLAEPTVVEATE